MFPLQLLALIFIATPSPDEGKDKKRTDGQEGGRIDGQEGGRTDRKQTLRRGDVLVVPRTLFIHFGIYLGGDR